MSLRLILRVLIILISILWSRLCTIWNNLLNIDDTVVGLRLANHGSHHSLWKIMRLWQLVLNDTLRIVLLIEVCLNIGLIWVISSPRTSSRCWSLQTFAKLSNLRNGSKSFSTSLARNILLWLLLIHILFAESWLLYYILLWRMTCIAHYYCLISI